MNIGLYSLTSALHNEDAVNVSATTFISEIENALGFEFDFKGSDFSDYGTHDLDLIYVRTGGTEGLFKEILWRLDGPIRILTSGKSNSLAASMEIMSYLNAHNHSGEIIHGNTDYIVNRITTLAKASIALRRIHGSRLGVIGDPSEWLISSGVDRPRIADRLGISLIDIPMTDVVAEYNKVGLNNLEGFADEMKMEFDKTAPEAVKVYVEGAFKIYLALKNIIIRHNLSGMTLRCFDLFDTLGNTGCMALAILNAEGIPAGCEGDVPALISMTIGNALTGVSGFQANPARIDPVKGEILFAHCSIPLNMVRRYSFNTHFESGIGIAISGQMPLGDATIFKISGDLSRTFCCEAVITATPSGDDLCRTQAVLEINGTDAERRRVCKEYFLKNPISNHHIIFPGKCKELFDTMILSL